MTDVDVERQDVDEAAPFTVGEKLGTLIDRFFEQQPSDARTRAGLAAVRTARKLGLLAPLLQMFPPLDDEEAWHWFLGVAVGIALNLPSDGFELDVERAKREGRQVLVDLLNG